MESMPTYSVTEIQPYYDRNAGNIRLSSGKHDHYTHWFHRRGIWGFVTAIGRATNYWPKGGN